MDPSISVQNEKIALQLKYLLSLPQKTGDSQTIDVLNRLYPFTQFPLQKLPPIQLFEYQANEVITDDLKVLLQSYSFVIILGKCRVQKSIYLVDQQKFIDESIKQKLVFNLDEGKTQLKAVNSVTLLKIHNIWLKIAKQAEQNKIKIYIKNKLIKIPFFAMLQFQQFDKICQVAELKTIGPNQTLIQEGSVPYHMYIVTEGELVLQKKVDFVKEKGVWHQFQQNIQKRQAVCEQLLQYLVRQPSLKNDIFTIRFQIKTVGEGTILCATETLNQTRISYSITSSLKTKFVQIKYPDLYVLQQKWLSEIRTWTILEIDKRQLRRQYYYQKNWDNYKHYLMEDQLLTSLEAQTFYDFLRKNVNLSMKKYAYSSNKVGEGYIVDSPAERVNRMKEMTYKKG